MTDAVIDAVELELKGDILVAIVDNPPVNALSHGVRAGLVAAVDRLEKDGDARAMVIVCAGRTFMAGADIREFGKPMKDPQLGHVIDRLDACDKPIVAAMHGTALGGGLEVALACSYRIADADARFGLPEVTLGLLPGSGGIVRTPRLIGVEAALPMITEGRPITADHAQKTGLIDEIATGDLRQDAVAFAARIVAEGATLRRTSDLPVPDYDRAILDQARKSLSRKFKGQNAPQQAVDLIEMVSDTPFRDAADREFAACKALVASPQSKALRHVFAAERAALKIDGVTRDTQPREVRKVAVVGPGTMGRGIAICFLDVGLPVVLIGNTQETLDKADTVIRKIYGGQIKRGRLTEAQVADRMAALTLTLDYDGLDGVDLAIEAVTEDMDVKKTVLSKLDKALHDRAIIATNTSFLDIETLASSLSRPENFSGMHFFNPANVMKLLENVRASKTAPDVLATMTTIGRKLGKTPVMVGRSEGFVANRMLSKRSREAQFLLEDGATPQQVDRVLTGFGFPIGPFALADLAGMDIMAAARQARIGGMTQRERDCDIVNQLAAAGRLGRKTGSGYYLYDEDGKGQPDPAVEEILAAHRTKRGLPQRDITDQEILERCLYAMVNEGAHLLDEGGAARPGDIDVIWTSGFGWPRHLGGPMFWADQIGLASIKDALDTYCGLVGDEYFTPANLIETRVAEGRGFFD